MLSDINQIMQDIWSGFLQLQLKECDPSKLTPHESFVGKIQIIGNEQNWEVILSCGTDASRAAAGAMFMADPSTVPDDDVKETVAELTNMIGGNIKTLLPGHNTLSLPLISSGSDDTADSDPSDAELVLTAGYTFNSSNVRVRVFKKASS